MDVSLYFSCERFMCLFIYELVFIYIYSVCAPAKINAFPPFLPPFSHISLLWIIKWLLPEFNLEATHSWAFFNPFRFMEAALADGAVAERGARVAAAGRRK